MGLFDAAINTASLYTETKAAELSVRKHRLQAQLEDPESWVEKIGGRVDVSFTDRSARIAKDELRGQLQEYQEIRVDGGIIAALLEARALMAFGVGGTFTSEEDQIAEWLNNQFDSIDLLTYDLGADATFYGYSLAEIRETTAGEFGELTFIEPWTTVPELAPTGEITTWEQEVVVQGHTHTQEFDPDDIWHFKVMKASGRDPLGTSLLGRGMTEAMHYRENQEAIQNAVRMAGFPTLDVAVGREGGAVIDDNDLKRVRPQFDNIHEKTKFIHGRDMDINFISPEGFEFEGITEHDLSKLAIAFMLPVELTQVGGGDGLGTGFPARLRERMFLLSATSQQRVLGGQLVELGKHLLREYSPFDAMLIDDLDIRFDWNEPITDLDELKTKVEAIGDDMTVNERRQVFGMPAVEDDAIGEGFESPGETEPEPAMFQETEHTLQSDAVSDCAESVKRDNPEMDESTAFAICQDMENQGLLSAEPPDDWDAFEAYLDGITEHVVAADHALFGFSDGATPAFVKAALFEAVLEGSEIFSDIKNIPDRELIDFRLWMADSLTDEGWTITEMRDRLMDDFGLDEDIAETTARSTTQNMVSEAADTGYRERDDFDELRFRWAGPDDHRNSDVCPEIKERVPDGGLPLDDLKALVQETAKELDLDPRGYTPHPNCRHRPVRVVEG